MDKQVSFKNKYTLQERLEKSKRQMEANPNKIVVIVEKHPTSSIPNLPNPRFLCEKTYKFSVVRNMLQKRIKESIKAGMEGKSSFFIFVKGTYPNPEESMIEIYKKYQDEDGFLYMQYSDQESL